MTDAASIPGANGPERPALLARMSSLFEAGRDSEATLQGVVNLFVPAFADWCAVDVMDGAGKLRRVNSASLAYADRKEAIDEIRAFPSKSFGEYVEGLLENREGAVIVEIADIAQLPWTPATPEVTALIASQIPLSMIFAPLRAHGTRLGSLHVGRANGVRPFVPDDSALVDEVAQRSAFALHTAQLVEALERELALRESATTALEESESRYRDLFRASPFPLLVHDVETKQILAVNDAAVAQYGFSEKEFLARTLIDIRPAEDVEQVKEVLSQKTTGPRVLRAFRHRRKDGSVFLVEVSSQSITFGGRAARITHAQDITEREEAYRSLRIAEERHRLVSRATKEAIWEWNRDRNEIEWNPMFAELFHYAPEHIGNTYMWRDSRIHPDDRDGAVDVLLQAFAERQELCTRRFRFQRGDSVYAHVDDRAVIAYDEDGPTRVVGSMADVTVQHQLGEQLAIAQRMEAIGRLAGGVAHDFNNLLTAIRGFATFALEEQAQDSTARDDIAQILLASDRAAALTRQLLAFSRRQVLQPQLVNVNDLIKALQLLLSRVLGEDIDLQTFLDPEAALVVVDPGQFEQMIMNLVVNARDAMPDGGRLTIESSNVLLDAGYARAHDGSVAGEYVQVAISDTGVGMDGKTLARIFEPFFSTKERDRGTGLGLATTYGIVKQSGGHIWVYSEPGRGSSFKIYLPRAQPAGTLPHLPPQKDTEASDGQETILLVEDDERVRRVSSEALRRHGYHVLEARSGEGALALFKEHLDSIAMVVSDVVLPRMSGPQLVQALRQLRPDTPALFVSGYTENAIFQRGVADQGVELLEKPFAPEALARRVRKILDSGTVIR